MSGIDGSSFFGLVAVCLIVLFVYCLPTILAIGKRDFTAICLVNLLVGWTFIGWVVAIVWAVKKDVPHPVERDD